MFPFRNGCLKESINYVNTLSKAHCLTPTPVPQWKKPLTYIISMMYQHALYIHPVQAGLAHNDDAYLATAYILTDTKTMFLKNLEATLHSDATTMLDNILQSPKASGKAIKATL